VNVLITGGLGFVGTQLSIQLLDEGDSVTVVDHIPRPKSHASEQVKYIYADTSEKGPWQDEVAGHDAVVNLAGASIFRRWTKKSKESIYESRVFTTRNLVEAMSPGSNSLLCSISAVGYYGFRGDEEIAESGAPGDDFLARLCVAWEREALKAEDMGVRVVMPRFGIVLGKTGGALGQMIPAFKGFVGGPLGSGNQWFSWIHMDDLLNALLFVLEDENMSGPVNFCTPNPVRNRELAKELGRALSRPSILRAPGFMVRVVLGEFGDVLLEGQRVVPEKLLKSGFVFKYPELRETLREVVGANASRVKKRL